MAMIVVTLLFMCIILLIHKITTLKSKDEHLEQFKEQCLGRYGIIMMLITILYLYFDESKHNQEKDNCLHTFI